MIFKSYLVENNIKILDKKLVLFYGENIGLKNDFKNNLLKVFKNDEIIRLNQEEIIKNKKIIPVLLTIKFIYLAIYQTKNQN